MILYGAYGSNLNMEQMQYRCPTAKMAGRAILKGYRLAFKGEPQYSYLDIVKYENSDVPIGLWYIEDEDERALDRYEGYPRLYEKDYVEVECLKADGTTTKAMAMVYYMTDARTKEAMPSMNYWRTCWDGYIHFNFDGMKYLKPALERVADAREEEDE